MNLIEKKSQNGLVVLSLTAHRLDAVNGADALQEMLSHLQERSPRVVLDLEQVSYLSSAGLRTIIQAAKHVSASGGRFALCCVRPAVLEIISIAGFESMIPVLPGRTEAAGDW